MASFCELVPALCLELEFLYISVMLLGLYLTSGLSFECQSRKHACQKCKIPMPGHIWPMSCFWFTCKCSSACSKPRWLQGGSCTWVALPLPTRFLLLTAPGAVPGGKSARELTGLKINSIKKTKTNKQKILFPAERKEGVPVARAVARQPMGQQPAPHLHQNTRDLLLDFNITGSFFYYYFLILRRPLYLSMGSLPSLLLHLLRLHQRLKVPTW